MDRYIFNCTSPKINKVLLELSVEPRFLLLGSSLNIPSLVTIDTAGLSKTSYRDLDLRCLFLAYSYTKQEKIQPTLYS